MASVHSQPESATCLGHVIINVKVGPHFSPHSVCCRLDWSSVHYVALVGLECLEAIVPLPQASDY